MGQAPLLHGTRQGFARGGLVLPRSKHAGAGTLAPINAGHSAAVDAENFVYATTDEDLAWAYAFAAPGRGRPRVLVLEPLDVVEPDPEHSAAMHAYRTRAAAVVDVRTTPTITEQEACAGWQTA